PGWATLDWWAATRLGVVLEDVRRGEGHGPIRLNHIHEELVLAIDAHGDDDAGAKHAAAVGARDIDVVRGDGSFDGALGGPVLCEARERIVGIFAGMLLPVG